MVAKKFDVDVNLVKKLAKLLDESNLGEIEYEKGDERIRLSKNSSAIFQSSPPVSSNISTVSGTGNTKPAEQKNTSNASTEGSVPSPMVGTAYLSSQPGSAPFVSVGDRVNKGQTILIIEAMKVMNPIPAPQSGIVQSILIHDGQPVEFGQSLMTIV